LYIGDALSERKNNFDFIRFVAAITVVFSHSFALQVEPLMMYTNSDLSFGRLAVGIFFIISGFLITKSYDQSNNIIKFVVARALRILPALIAVTLLSVFVIGTIFTTLPLNDYFSNPETFRYLKNILMHPPQWTLPEVFKNNHNPSINAPIWSLEFEVFCYLIVAVLGVVKILRKEIVLIGFISLYFIPHIQFFKQFYFASSLSIELIKYFMAGMLFYLFRKHIPLKKNLAIISTVMLVIGISFIESHFKLLFTVFGTYLIMYLAFLPTKKLNAFAKRGDLSYGIYIYTYPIQQMLYVGFGTLAIPSNIFTSAICITLIVSYLSWHLIEKPALNLKNRILNYHKRKNKVEITTIKVDDIQMSPK
jgi:peptidoglycan/LPS O-acetylase OafA/YrhL